MRRGIGRRPAADQSVPTIDRDMVLVTERRNRDVDLRCAIFARLGLTEFHRPACIAILLAQFRWTLRPLPRDASRPDLSLLSFGIALLWRSDDRCIHNLPAHREIASLLQSGVKACKQPIDCAGPLQRLPEGPDRVRVRHNVPQTQTEK